jgi:hypothetical protein
MLFAGHRGSAQSLTVTNDIQSVATLTNTAATGTGQAELQMTGTRDVMPGSTVNLISPDGWLPFSQRRPQSVRDTFLSRIQVDGAAAVLDGNVRIVWDGDGAMVIAHPPDFRPLEAWDGCFFRGTSWKLAQYGAYDTASLGDRAAPFRDFPSLTGTAAQDHDGDGAPNLAEYALGTNPVASSCALATQLTHANGQLESRWTQASSALEATVQPEWSDTLTTWSTSGITIQVIADNGTFRTLRVTLPSGTSQRFVRLRISLR